MGSVNKAMIIGYVGKDPEIKSLQDGTRLANFSIATSESWRDKQSGERKEKTEWHRIVVWGENPVKIVADYVRKGDQICVEGKIETRKWLDKDKNERFSTEIVVKGFGGHVTLLSSKGKGGSGRDAGQDDDYLQERPASRSGGGGQSQDRDLNDDIPF